MTGSRSEPAPSALGAGAAEHYPHSTMESICVATIRSSSLARKPPAAAAASAASTAPASGERSGEDRRPLRAGGAGPLPWVSDAERMCRARPSCCPFSVTKHFRRRDDLSYCCHDDRIRSDGNGCSGDMKKQ